MSPTSTYPTDSDIHPADSLYEDTVHLYPRWDGNYSLEIKHEASKGITNV